MAGADVFSERLNRLFAVVYPPDRGPYTNAEVIAGLARRDTDLSAPYLSQLRSGHRAHPSIPVIVALSDFFGVRPSYLRNNDPDYCEALDTELTWMEMARDERLRELVSSVLELPADIRDEALAEVAAR